MKGSNKIILCLSEMRAALQYYFENALFKDGKIGEVTNVEVENSVVGSRGFVITVSKREEVNAKCST